MKANGLCVRSTTLLLTNLISKLVCVDTSVGGLFVHDGIIDPVVRVWTLVYMSSYI